MRRMYGCMDGVARSGLSGLVLSTEIAGQQSKDTGSS